MGKLDGSCLCGKVTYVCDAEPLATANCHCKHCQKSTGSAFSTVVVVPEDSLEISGDTLAVYITTSEETGLPGRRHFCTNCGSPLLTKLDGSHGLVYVKAGTLNDTSRVSPVLDVWTESKQAWSDHGERMALPHGPTAEVMAQLSG
jgi:hypothetical protein